MKDKHEVLRFLILLLLVHNIKYLFKITATVNTIILMVKNIFVIFKIFFPNYRNISYVVNKDTDQILKYIFLRYKSLQYIKRSWYTFYVYQWRHIMWMYLHIFLFFNNFNSYISVQSLRYDFRSTQNLWLISISLIQSYLNICWKIII